MLLGAAVDACARVAAVEAQDAPEARACVNVARPEILREGDAAGVEHDSPALPIAAHHRGKHGHGRVVETAASVRHLEGVEEGVVAGPDLGDAGELAGVGDRGGRAEAHGLHCEAGRTQPFRRRDDHVALLLRRSAHRSVVGGGVGVAGVGEHSGEAQRRSLHHGAR